MFRNLLNGRYGIDNFTFFILALAVIFLGHKYVWIIGVGLIGYAVYRVFSTNINKRRQELEGFNRVAGRFMQLIARIGMKLVRGLWTIKNKYYGYRAKLQQRKQYVFLKCPKCRKVLRLPRNKGKLLVTCPVCKAEFFKKT